MSNRSIQALRSRLSKGPHRQDLISGFLVFLIALPLCLGISMASGFPPIAGILTAIIGGLVVSPLMGSRLSIKGPAAGLIAIAIGAVTDLGEGDMYAGYRYALAVIVAASLLQVLFGWLKLGRYVDFFPSSAVQGMLAAIGIIILAKQIPVLLGVSATQSNPLALLAEIPSLVTQANVPIALIGGLSLLILFGLPRIQIGWVKKIPTPMLVLLIAMPLGRYFDLGHEHAYLWLDQSFSLGPEFLVALPGNLLDGITFPDFGKIFTLTSWQYILMFAIVGSLESLLTVKAIDGMDPARQKSDANRDLFAVGIGNTLSGLIGGLPMIAEVVRSSANVGNGAKTRWSNFAHGGFLLLFVACFPALIQQIPLSALAAMLIYTGVRLASPALFRQAYQVGKEQLAVFLLTILVTLATDLLMGIAAGVALEIMVYWLSGVSLRSLFRSEVAVARLGDEIWIEAREAVTFTNFLGFKRRIEAIPPGQRLVLDFHRARLIDHSFMVQLQRFQEDYESQGGQVRLLGLDTLTPVSAHALCARRAS